MDNVTKKIVKESLEDSAKCISDILRHLEDSERTESDITFVIRLAIRSVTFNNEQMLEMLDARESQKGQASNEV